MNLVIESNAKEFALRHGVLSLEEVVTWADALIEKMDEPPVELFDVSLAKDLNSIIEALGCFGRSNEKTTVAKLIFRYFYDNLSSSQPNYERVARGLYDMFLQEIAPMAPPSGEMACYWDDLDLAERGYVGTLEEVQQNMLNLLKVHKC